MSTIIEASTDRDSAGRVCLAAGSLEGSHAARITVTGELDIASVGDLDRTLRRAEAHAALIVLDLGELDFVDASGAQLLLTASRRLRRAGRRLVIVRSCPEVQWFFALVGLDEQLDIQDDPPAHLALARSFATGAP